MANPLRFLKTSPTEKRLLIGGLIGGLTYWVDKMAQEYIPEYPAELKSQLDPHLPNNGDIIASVTPPIVLYMGKKVVKSASRKEKVGNLAFGSLLYSIPHLVEQIVAKTAYAEGGGSVAARLASARALASRTPVARSNYQVTVTNRVAQSSGLSKYRVTS